MAKKPILTEDQPVSLINLDPVAAARSVDAVISQKTDEFDFLSEKIMVQFYNIEQSGRKGYFVYGPSNNPTKIEIAHGEARELTRADVRYIESRQTPIYEYAEEIGNATLGTKTRRVKKLIGWRPRFQCREIRMPKTKAM